VEDTLARGALLADLLSNKEKGWKKTFVKILRVARSKCRKIIGKIEESVFGRPSGVQRADVGGLDGQ